MEDKQGKQLQGQVDLYKRLESIMVHPEWKLVIDLIDDERKLHANKAKDPVLRQDPNEYPNIVRALDNADAVGAILTKFNTIIRLGKEAREKLDVAAGINSEPE